MYEEHYYTLLYDLWQNQYVSLHIVLTEIRVLVLEEYLNSSVIKTKEKKESFPKKGQ